MSSGARHVHYTYAEYLRLEDPSPTRHEHLDGEIYAMPGGSPDHAALAGAVIRLLGAALPRGCRVFTSNLRGARLAVDEVYRDGLEDAQRPGGQ